MADCEFAERLDRSPGIDQTAAPSGVQTQALSGNAIGVQVIGDDNVVQIGTATLRLLARHSQRSAPTNIRELMLTEFRGTALVGRDDDMADLRRWLGDAAPMAARCVVGPGGSGKTRIGIEICDWAASNGWVAGFAERDSLAHFRENRGLSEWEWSQPTLIVVDYAASAAREIRAWLEGLARKSRRPDRPPFRLLLLERHADTSTGWWRDVIAPAGVSGLGPDDLVGDGQPVPLHPLESATHHRALLSQAVSAAAALEGKPEPAIPKPGADSAFDDRLNRTGIETGPLFLIMAGIEGLRNGVPAAMALDRGTLAQRVAAHERARLVRLAEARGWNADDICHLAACATIQGGCDKAAAERLVRDEWTAMRWPAGRPAQEIAAWLGQALPRSEDGIDRVRPDLIGEAFAAAELTRDGKDDGAAVARAWHRDKTGTIDAVVRTAQDYAFGARGHRSLAWADRLIDEARSDPADIMLVSAAMPEQTTALREHAHRSLALLVGAIDAVATADPAIRAHVASLKNNLGNRLSELGMREDALAAAREAVDIRRALAAERPDAFRPYLATSLAVLSNCLDAAGDPSGALAAVAEALATIAPAFIALPAAHGRLALAICKDYVERSGKCGREPDMPLLAPIIPALQALMARGGDEV